MSMKIEPENPEARTMLDLTRAAYDQLPGVNWSTLKAIRISPKHYDHRLTAEQPDTPAMQLGRMVHTGVFEPEKFDARWTVMPRFHGGMKDETALAKGYEGGREAKAEWEEANRDREITTVDQYTTARDLCVAIRSDPDAGPCVSSGDHVEDAISWTDEKTGIECKGIIDLAQGRTLVELKTTHMIQPERFQAEAVRAGHLAQVAFYFDGMRAMGLDVDVAILIAAESTPPFDVVTYELGDDALGYGRSVYRDCLKTLKRCRAKNEWPGVGRGGPRMFELPPWAATDEPLTIGGVPLEV
jgi:hypothetical protein